MRLGGVVVKKRLCCRAPVAWVTPSLVTVRI